MSNNEVCRLHSGHEQAIEGLRRSDSKQWEEIGQMRARIDRIMNRLNVILGGIVVACILLIINLALKTV